MFVRLFAQWLWVVVPVVWFSRIVLALEEDFPRSIPQQCSAVAPWFVLLGRVSVVAVFVLLPDVGIGQLREFVQAVAPVMVERIVVMLPGLRRLPFLS